MQKSWAEESINTQLKQSSLSEIDVDSLLDSSGKNQKLKLQLSKSLSYQDAHSDKTWQRRQNKQYCIRRRPQDSKNLIFTEKVEIVKKEITPTDLFFIAQALEKHKLFSQLTAEQRESLALKFVYCHSTGEFVYQEGDPASLFFILDSGECIKLAKGKIRQTLTPQQNFGNLDLIRGSPRTTSIKIVQKSTFWALTERLYKTATHKLLQQQIQENYHIIHEHQFFQIMSEQQKNELVSTNFTYTFKIGETIAAEDQVSESFFIIKKGSVLVKKGDKEVIMLDEGSEFGNKQFLQGLPYGYTYIAYSDSVQCLAIEKLNIERVMGVDLIKFEIDNLQRYACETNPKLKILTQLQIEKIIKKTQVVDKNKGDVLIQRGEPIQDLYFVLDGLVQDEQGNVVARRGNAIYDESPKAAETLKMGEDGQLAKIPLVDFYEQIGGSYHQALIEKQFSFELFLKRKAAADLAFDASNIKISDLIVIKKLGSGGFSEVYLCKIKEQNFLFAVKVQSKAFILEHELEKQVLEEKQIMEMIDFPYTMRFYGALADNYNFYFLLEFICGMELFDAMRQRGLFSYQELAFYAGSLILCLEYLSSVKIVYRDLKPENIMLDHQGYIKMIDFGVSKRLPELGAKTYTITGTPTYIAPEVVEGRGYSYAADLWSLGILLFELLCGPSPFGNDFEDPYKIYDEILKKDLEFPEFVTNQPVKDLISQLLSKKPYKRLIGKSWPKLKSHQYFEDIKFNWEMLMRREITPPFVPSIDQKEKQLCIQEALNKNQLIVDVVQKSEQVVSLEKLEGQLLQKYMKPQSAEISQKNSSHEAN